MKTFLQHKAWKIGLALLILLVTLMSGEGTQKASADIAPPGPPLGDSLSPSSENTNVRMMWEYVLLDIAGYSSYRDGHANVTAEFQMRNLGDAAEYMQVRFPLSNPIGRYFPSYEDPELKPWDPDNPDDPERDPYCYPSTPYIPIEGFTVWVNGEKLAHDTQYRSILDYEATRWSESDENVYVDVPCWAYFNVTFPPSEDVYIKVSYIVSGYDGGDLGQVAFYYILYTGAGWRDTIGEATIVARLPYEINETNFLWCDPEDCVLSGTDVTWHYEDFEPDSNIYLSIIKPDIWMDILTERENVLANPNDGEAWGRLGKAYKWALIQYKGVISTSRQPFEELYNLSVEAYTNAVTLLPDDAEWHYGFADLLCDRAMWGNENTFEIWYPCAEQLNLTLQIDPEHEGAHRILEWLSYGIDHVPEKFFHYNNGSEVDFLILTPGVTFPTDMPTRTRVPDPTVWQPNTPTPGEPGSAYQVPQQWWAEANPTAENTPTVSTTPEAQSTPTRPAAATATSTPAAPSSSSTPAFIGAGVLLVALLVVVIVVRARRG